MGIDLQCPSCGERLRVADASAGKNAICPKCQTVFPAPAAGAAAAEPRRAEPVSSPDGAESPQMWQMKTPAGESYGPVSRQELDSWAADGRISADYQLLATGSDRWQWASDVFPALASGDGGAAINVNPYSSPPSAGTAFSTPGFGRDVHLNPGIKICVLVSGIGNILVGLFWISTLCGVVIGVPQIVLAIFEIIYFAQADKKPLDDALSQGKLLGIFEIVSGLFNLISLVCGILVLVFASNHKP